MNRHHDVLGMAADDDLVAVGPVFTFGQHPPFPGYLICYSHQPFLGAARERPDYEGWGGPGVAQSADFRIQVGDEDLSLFDGVEQREFINAEELIVLMIDAISCPVI